jgi:hypothetical protein
MASRGYDVTGIDLNERAVRYVRQRLRRRQLEADVFVGDMTYARLKKPVDAAFNTFKTFRHLTSEAAALSHLEAMSANVRLGGIYILGFHLLPPDADEEDEERWSARHSSTKVNITLRVLKFDRKKRIEILRFVLRVRRGSRELRLQSDYAYRIYTAAQLKRLLAKVPGWEVCDVFDFWYEIGKPLALNDDLGDTVLVLRRV